MPKVKRSLAIQQLAHQRDFDLNGVFGAHFLTAIAANAPVIFVRRGILLIFVVPVERFWVNGAGTYADAAFHAALCEDIRPWCNCVL